MVSQRWERWQQERLALENRALASEFPDFRFYDAATTEAYVEGWWTSNGGRRYRIRLQLAAGYPDVAPRVFIMDPFPLRGWGGKAIHRYGTSHNMHTWASTKSRATQLCTVRSEVWDPSWTLVQMITKAELWILAYEFHCQDGQPIAAYLRDYR